MLNFHLQETRTLGNKLRNTILHTIPHIYLSQVAVHMCGTRMHEWNIWTYDLPLWSFLGSYPPLLDTTYLVTSTHQLPVVQKLTLFTDKHLPSNIEKWGLGIPPRLLPLFLILQNP